jgi:hypothetical protein
LGDALDHQVSSVVSLSIGIGAVAITLIAFAILLGMIKGWLVELLQSVLKQFEMTANEFMKLDRSGLHLGQALSHLSQFRDFPGLGLIVEQLSHISSRITMNQALIGVAGLFRQRKHSSHGGRQEGRALPVESALEDFIEILGTHIGNTFPSVKPKVLVVESARENSWQVVYSHGARISPHSTEILNKMISEVFIASLDVLIKKDLLLVRSKIQTPLPTYLVLFCDLSSDTNATGILKKDWEGFARRLMALSETILASHLSQWDQLHSRFLELLKKDFYDILDPSPHFISSPKQLVSAQCVPCLKARGDFLSVFHFEKNRVSVVFLGKVAGDTLATSLLAASLQAILAQNFYQLQEKRESAPHVILEYCSQSLNRYLYNSYKGKISIGFQAIYFNHDSGQGFFVSFAQPFPFVLSPHERKPMVVIPAVMEGQLGLQMVVHAEVTAFAIMPGQILLACNKGVLDTVDPNGKKFEKSIQRGVLSEMISRNSKLNSQEILDQFLDLVRKHKEDLPALDDITAAVLVPINPFHKETGEGI